MFVRRRLGPAPSKRPLPGRPRAHGRSKAGGRADEGGAALVEFALLALPLCLFLMGIISFGMILATKQTITQAAAEGARSAVPVAAPSSNTTPVADQARTQAANSANWLKPVSCTEGAFSAGGLRCDTNVALCPSSTTNYCITLKVTYDYKNRSVIPPIPLIDKLLPSTISSQSVVQLAGVS